MMRKRADKNGQSIREVLVSGGMSIFNTGNVGGGFTDYVGGLYRRNYLIETKNREWGWKLTPAQERFHAEWRGEIIILETVDQAIEWMNTLRTVR